MVKQFRSDGTEIRDGESAVPGYTPFHLREAVSEGSAAPEADPPTPVCGDPDPESFKWWEEDIPPVRPELLDAIDPGEPTPVLTINQASENNIQRVVDLVTSHLIHDERYAPLKLRDQITVLVLAINRLVWQSDVLRNHEWNLPYVK